MAYLTHNSSLIVSSKLLNYHKASTKQAYCAGHEYCLMASHNYHINAREFLQRGENILMKRTH